MLHYLVHMSAGRARARASDNNNYSNVVYPPPSLLRYNHHTVIWKHMWQSQVENWANSIY